MWKPEHRAACDRRGLRYPRLEDKAIVAWISPGAPKEYQLTATCQIEISQIPSLRRAPVLTALRDFASLTESIIKLFN